MGVDNYIGSSSSTRPRTTRPATATTVTPGGYDPSRKAPPYTPTGNLYTGGNRPPDGFFDLINQSATNNNINPFGGVRTSSSGSGGGGSGGSGTSVNWDSLYGMIGAGKPTPYEYTPLGDYTPYEYQPLGEYQGYQYEDLDLPEYNAPEFYRFNSEPYDVAQRTINEQIAAGTSQGNRTYGDAFTELNQWANPYGTVRTQNPGVQEAMARMMQANGINPEINSQVDWEGQQADDAFGYTQALLAGTAAQQQDSNLRALSGDQRRFNESMGTEGRLLGAQVQMALANARVQYEKDLFMYGKEEADKRWEAAVLEATTNNTGRNAANLANTQGRNSWAMADNQGRNEAGMSNNQGVNAWGLANNQGVNQANQANWEATNSWQQGALAPILEILMSGEEGVTKGFDPWKLMVGLQDNAGLMKAFMPQGGS